MSKKDDADRRANELLKIEAGAGYATVKVADWRLDRDFSTLEDAESVALEIRSAIADAIRASVADAEHTAALAQRDLQIDSEAFHEGWQMGAEAMRRKVVLELVKLAVTSATVPSAVADFAERLPLPGPPSHDHHGAPLPPSRLRVRAERMEKKLGEIREVFDRVDTDYIRDVTDAQALIREALQEPSDE